MKTLVRYLELGRRFITPIENWTRNEFTRDFSMVRVDPSHTDEIKCACLTGAPLAVLLADANAEIGISEPIPPQYEAMERKIMWSCDHAAMRLYGPTKTASMINDLYGHEAALKVLDEAIRYEKERGKGI